MADTYIADSKDVIAWTAEIVASHLQNNNVDISDLPQLIKTVHDSLIGLTGQYTGEKPQPAVSVRRSVTPDYIICLEDGRKLKMMKRHLWTAYGMTPEVYREKWGLPADYPMVAPNYAKQRSSLAKKIGLGKRRDS
ncbi:MAG: Transcriptional regulatory protein ros [Alphaproteobacteria bacterium MarineAlpha11_Bin1]|nr:MAG: Transcriptional regulatory protein ros [Alphaproteobacteria bacterium MarineAlpha11_Bin1]|tara:strand:- start:15228 stop:15635 length:408 start_codon:yes stop_codon:yes gene_type:complete